MKIYVDEMPKNCDECKLKQVINKTKDGLYTSYQCPFKDGELAFGDNPYRRKCPLHPVAEREAELIKRIKLAIRKQVHLMEDSEHCYPQNAVCWQDIVAILDQVERREK